MGYTFTPFVLIENDKDLHDAKAYCTKTQTGSLPGLSADISGYYEGSPLCIAYENRDEQGVGTAVFVYGVGGAGIYGDEFDSSKWIGNMDAEDAATVLEQVRHLMVAMPGRAVYLSNEAALDVPDGEPVVGMEVTAQVVQQLSEKAGDAAPNL